MINRKNIIVIAIMAIMLMGSVILSAATYTIQVTSNYPGTGFIEIQTLDGNAWDDIDVAYIDGTIQVSLWVPDGPQYYAYAWGTNGLPLGLLNNDEDWQPASSGITSLELDLSPFSGKDPNQPITE